MDVNVLPSINKGSLLYFTFKIHVLFEMTRLHINGVSKQ